MPIIIKDFTWKQTDYRICIQVSLRGIHPNKVDIFTSPQYIKATFGSFFFDALLLNPVDISESRCTKTSSYIMIDLKKIEEVEWVSLEIINISKQEKNTLKRKLIQEEHERIQKSMDEKNSKKAELKRIAINEQIKLDTKIRNEIDYIKNTEEKKALGDLNEWKNNVETHRKADTKLVKIKDKEKNLLEIPSENASFTVPLIKKNKTVYKPKPPHKESIAVPKPRDVRSLQILFTAREFPTPSRESRLEEENEFLCKQAEARRSVGFIDEDLRPEEKNPQYLLAKGREFLKNKNYLGAISAFSFGIKLSPKFVDLYLARSEAHINVGNFQRTIEDSTSALNLLKPLLPINLHDRAICFGRRGVGLFKLGFFKQGISELEASLKLNKTTEFESILEEFKIEFEELKSKKQTNGENTTDK